MINFLIKVILSIVFGGLVGLQRSLSHKQAGLRTFSLVALGACAFTVFIQMFIFDKDSIARILANIVLGIGFLGSGVIFSFRGKVTGLTTAAAMWVTAAIGLGVGLGFYIESFIVTLLTIFILHFLYLVEAKLTQSKNDKV
jgi:putative Mg2+ transporter-C (MgtC) family protein